MENGQPKSSRLSVEKITAIVICLFLLWPLAQCGLPLLLPKKTDHSLAHVNSPDGKWSATVSERVYASTFSGAEFVVTLSTADTKEVFIIEEDAISQPQIKWQNSTTLVISATQKQIKNPVTKEISLQLPEYAGIKIAYDIH